MALICSLSRSMTVLKFDRSDAVNWPNFAFAFLEVSIELK